MAQRAFKVGERVDHDQYGKGVVTQIAQSGPVVVFDSALQPDPITFTGLTAVELEPVREEIVRILRVIEYVGNREDVERQVANSLHGEKTFARGCTIRAATVGIYPEILTRGAA